MRTFWKRWRITIGSGFESLITRVENHEALVAEAIREAQSAAAKAKVKLAHVRRDGERLRERARTLATETESWERRAQAQADDNRERALECLRRRNTTRRELDSTTAELARHEQTERALSADISKLEDHVAGLRRRKNELAARDFRARALSATSPEEGTLLGGIDDIFERWELKLAESEIICEPAPADDFADGFMAEEEKAELEAELDALLKPGPDDRS
ncbi:PspA/IM30 family protein [Ruficoccus amylovorans]|uniref:PspA/IM30 family protein n=1 Tax=Ruficoccus amylovorans TaxID=1804625 RepID=A0A842HDN9_9BACT|nr:PspA/IM30 family protein [Ruficoccus amylovorans]MBC2594552.1 PspA/IM30 family protein [Ruficoccus amylovorans]